MKKQLKSLLGLLMIILLTAGCSTPDFGAQYKKTVDMYYGTVAAEHYSNPWLKTELDLPSKWHLQEDPIKAAVVDAGDQIKDQKALDAAVKGVETSPVYNLLQLFKNPIENQKEFNPSLVMMVARIDGKGITDAAAYLEASRQAMAQRQMPMGFTQNLEAPVDSVDIGGMEFSHLPIIVETSLFAINQDYYALQLDDKMLGFMVSWRDEADRVALMNALSTLVINE